jgi:hypothetical protein
MGQRDGVIAPRLSSRRRKLVRHVHNIGHVIKVSSSALA